MAEQKESSVLFSLKELMNLEEDRIKQEEAERKRQEDAATQVRLQAEQRVREEDLARTRAEEERRRLGEQQAREEAARIDAIRHGEVEKARLDAENAARLEQLRRQQEHERHLHSLTHDKHKKQLKWIAIGTGAVLFIALVGGGIALKSQYDNAKKLEAQLSSLNGEREELNHRLQSATSPEERARLEQEIAEKEKAINDIKANPGAAPQKAPVRAHTGPAPTQKATGASKPCNCTPGDPLCSCL